MVRLQEVLDKVNDLFAGEDFTPAEQQSWVEGIVTVLMDDETIVTQATANTKKQFVESPDLSDAVTEAVLGNQVSHNKMADYFFADERIKVEFVKLLGTFMHENIHADVGDAPSVRS
jgi:type I restriction enzyme R subunit